MTMGESEGIKAKVITESLLSSAFEIVEGSTSPFEEVIQETFNNQIITSLGTGPIPEQKLSSHVDDSGIFHIFYYDENGRLCSSQGTNSGWSTTDNF